MNIRDIFYILSWFFVFFIIGLTFLPLTFSLFTNFKDKGYIFSKIIGIAVLSYAVFILGLLRIATFSLPAIILSLIFFVFLNYYAYRKNNIISVIKSNLKVFVLEELMFLFMLIVWSYVRANNPDVFGLEKYMDFGFVNSILRSTYFPPKDMWYTPLPINYYYFGHLVAAVLTKLTQIPSFISFNLMVSTIFAFTFTASFSIGLNFFPELKSRLITKMAGVLGAVILTLGGNLTTIYAFLRNITPVPASLATPTPTPIPFWKLTFFPFGFPNGYWYPDATRFIPFTIHEFPLYSFVVSDLHGHVLDISFVLLIIALSLSIIFEKRFTLFHSLFISFLLGVMYMTNAWDGFIYLLLTIAVILTVNYPKKGWRNLLSNYYLYNSFKNTFVVIIGFLAFSLPFSINFKPFVSGIGVLCGPTILTKIGKIGPFLFEPNHCQKSALWQLALLYGFFYFFVFCFIAFLKLKKQYKITPTDIFVLILIILSTVLIIVPEFIYVKDIYPMHYRANTMFKLVYEAFMMLSLSSGYIIIKLLLDLKNRIIKLVFFIAALLLIFLILIYPYFAINSYYDNLKSYKSLNGLAYLKQSYPEDYDLINWINKNIKGQPVILEANGDSYTQYARISANTGLPTVIGWSVHEWLWRGTYDIVSPRITDVENLYTTNNLELAKSLINKYKISYVTVSTLEHQKYPSLNESTFIELGKLVYQNSKAKLYKINF